MTGSNRIEGLAANNRLLFAFTSVFGTSDGRTHVPMNATNTVPAELKAAFRFGK